jgi:hypothetical protein
MSNTALKTLVAAILLCTPVPAAQAADPQLEPLFNGKDLSGWVNVNVAPETFTVKDGLIVSTGKPTGIIRSEKQYENFILELEWRHMKPGGNAGLFVWSEPITAQGTPFARSIEVQILDGRNSETYTSHGDIFSIHGSHMKPDRPHPAGAQRCLPSERRAKPSPEWNHYRVVCNDGVIKLSVNGKEVSGGSECDYRKGYICLESEGSECHFRNIKLAELPSTGAKEEQTAPLAEHFKTLYTGLDLSGWKVAEDSSKHWTPADWVLKHQGEANARAIQTEEEFGDFTLICDWRLAGDKSKAATARIPAVFLRGSKALVQLAPDNKHVKPAGQWNRSAITVKGDEITVRVKDETALETKFDTELPRRGPIGLLGSDLPCDFASLLLRELK